jgi:hypothetical protein
MDEQNGQEQYEILKFTGQVPIPAQARVTIVEDVLYEQQIAPPKPFIIEVQPLLKIEERCFIQQG